MLVSRSVNEKEIFEEVLPLVSKPNRYVGNELGLGEKNWGDIGVRFLLSYPDTYEVGMSHTGTQILYHLVNRDPRWLLDRVYAPWPDMEAQLRARGIPLWGLHYRRPVREYDLLGFTLQSELTYTNLLNMIDLSGMAVRQADREESDPLIYIGGPCASNPEPLAPFVDFALIGDAEDAIGEILELIGDWKKTRGQTCENKSEFLQRLAVSVSGVYVPSLNDVVGGNRKPVRKAGTDVGTPIDVKLAGEWAAEERLGELLKTVNEKVTSGVEFFAAAAVSGKPESLSAGITSCTYHVEFPSRFNTTLGELETSFAALLARDSVVVTRTRKRKVQPVDVRNMIAEIAVVSSNEVLITVASGNSGSVKPTEIIEAAMDVEKDTLPLVKIHKIRATTATGESPVVSAVVLVEVEKFEKRNTYNWRPAGDPRGHSRGRQTC